MMFYLLAAMILATLGYYILGFNYRIRKTWHIPIIWFVLFILSSMIILVILGNLSLCVVTLLDDIYSDFA